MYASNIRPGDRSERTNLVSEVPIVTKDGVETVLRGMKRGKAAGDCGITIGQLNGGGYIIIEKRGKIFSECIRKLQALLSSKHANLILIHEKGGAK